jgi:chemotaxis protein CheC
LRRARDEYVGANYAVPARRHKRETNSSIPIPPAANCETGMRSRGWLRDSHNGSVDASGVQDPYVRTTTLMPPESFLPLTDLERDALGELSNIAMARAANSLRQMIKNEVLLSVPAVDILTNEAATRLAAGPNNHRLVAVRQNFDGAFSGRALLIFPEANSLELVRAVVGRELTLEDVVDLEEEALAETGNIILNSWVATIANLLKSALKMSLPVVIRGDSKLMFDDTRSGLVLFLHISFEVRQKAIGGYVALLMDIPSLGELRALITDFINSVTQPHT